MKLEIDLPDSPDDPLASELADYASAQGISPAALVVRLVRDAVAPPDMDGA